MDLMTVLRQNAECFELKSFSALPGEQTLATQGRPDVRVENIQE